MRSSALLSLVGVLILVACTSADVRRYDNSADAAGAGDGDAPEVSTGKEQAPRDSRLRRPGSDCPLTEAELAGFIEELMSVIADRDYEAWYEHLHDSYIEYFSQPEVLEEISEEAVLARRNVDLRSLEDYFQHVVVPSRAGKELASIDFVAPHKVKARTQSGGQEAVLFHLELSEGDWKISRF